MPIQDTIAIKHIGISAGMLSVPVNYVASAKPYVTQIVNAAYVNSVPVIPTSMCIGIRRHTIVDSGMSITFQSVNLTPRSLMLGLITLSKICVSCSLHTDQPY